MSNEDPQNSLARLTPVGRMAQLEPSRKISGEVGASASVKEDYFINKDSALYTPPFIINPTLSKESLTNWPASYWEQQQKLFPLTAYKVLSSIELWSSWFRDIPFMITKRDYETRLFWTKRSNTTLPLGYPEIRWNPSIPMVLGCP